MFPNINEMKIYLVCGTRADRFKALYWDKTGFVLYYKRIDNGHFQWPNDFIVSAKTTLFL
ncbi:IS66 family insertion sequence element accessory protein TnpB [Liquorilactobacillus nagelii]|uniref:IS66 family insertion sequence element accessory protein TnpB n=1 Tax=Liquorilactobacillus nagelii TaxID=82688 RepID=UPI001CC8FADA